MIDLPGNVVLLGEAMYQSGLNKQISNLRCNARKDIKYLEKKEWFLSYFQELIPHQDKISVDCRHVLPENTSTANLP